jgi:hypothetical protein
MITRNSASGIAMILLKEEIKVKYKRRNAYLKKQELERSHYTNSQLPVMLSGILI